MENTKNKLTPYQNNFLEKLKNYIEKPIYFYGSVMREDYLPGKSDIDIDIFTDNVESTKYSLCSFLNLQKKDLKRFVYKIGNNLVYGYKTNYKDNNILLEIAIYNEKYKLTVINEHYQTNILPFYILTVLFFIKILFYNFSLISKNTFRRCKRFLMNKKDEIKFIILDV